MGLFDGLKKKKEHKQREFVCKTCGKKFTSEAALKEDGVCIYCHAKAKKADASPKTAQKPKTADPSVAGSTGIACKKCGRKFTAGVALKEDGVCIYCHARSKRVSDRFV